MVILGITNLFNFLKYFLSGQVFVSVLHVFVFFSGIEMFYFFCFFSSFIIFFLIVNGFFFINDYFVFISIFFFLLKWLFFVIPLLLVVAFFTVFERKGLASVQRRRGPNVVGFAGLLQAIADAVKLFLKEYIIPSKATRFVFFFAPVLTMFVSLMTWTVIPFNLNEVLVDLNIGLLFLFAITGIGVFGIIFAGWSSNSKFPLLGAQRSGAQMLSYELVLSLCLISIFYMVKSANLTTIVFVQSNFYWFFFPLCMPFIIYLIMSIAELNRPPFDLPEAEAELVSGYNVEYSASGFVLFFLAEYLNVVYQSVLMTLLFFGGWDAPFGLPGTGSFWLSVKIVFLLSIIVLVRATLPRYRYDVLMRIAWKIFMPLVLVFMLLIIFLFIIFTVPQTVLSVELFLIFIENF